MLPHKLDPAQASPARVRMEQRTSAEAKALIERAAHALGISPSEFVTAAACREARATLHQCEATRVPPEMAQAFVDTFEREVPAPAMVDLMAVHAKVAAARAKTPR